MRIEEEKGIVIRNTSLFFLYEIIMKMSFFLFQLREAVAWKNILLHKLKKILYLCRKF